MNIAHSQGPPGPLLRQRKHCAPISPPQNVLQAKNALKKQFLGYIKCLIEHTKSIEQQGGTKKSLCISFVSNL